MLLLFFKMSIIVVFTLVGSYITVRLKARGKFWVHVGPVAGAVLGLVAVEILGIVDREWKRPDMSFTVIRPDHKQLKLRIANEGGPAERVDLDIPIFGRVLEVQDLESTVTRSAMTKSVRGAQTRTSENEILLTVHHLASNARLDLFVRIEPPSDAERSRIMEDLRIVFPFNKSADTLEEMLYLDRFHYRVAWQYSGSTLEDNQWISLKTGKPVDPPAFTVVGYEAQETPFQERSLGPPTHKVE